MQLRQIQVTHDVVQDRLVLRVATQADEEFRIFLTRRFLRELWPHLCAMLAGHLKSAAPAPAQSAATGTATSFDQPFRDDNATYPLGLQPLLASEAKLEPAGDGCANLLFREGRERRCNIVVNADLMQALCAMLRACSEKAGWNLGLDYGGPAAGNAAAAPTPAPGAKTLLH